MKYGIFVISIFLASCYQMEKEGLGKETCEQDRTYTMTSSSIPSTGGNFEVLSIATTYSISNSNCASLPDVSNASAPTFNVKLDANYFYLSSFTESSLKLQFSYTTSGNVDTLTPSNFTVENSFCKMEYQNFGGSIDYSNGTITLNYHVVYTNLDNCSAF
ncbi:MAG: hypothetical protein D6767_10980 [Candidatus Hydrogenedentota bacterium]|nr:MAG: hypothetical protein D6767_10980 [Candidatus Hydrogenedentota bacterium]